MLNNSVGGSRKNKKRLKNKQSSLSSREKAQKRRKEMLKSLYCIGAWTTSNFPNLTVIRFGKLNLNVNSSGGKYSLILCPVFEFTTAW